MDLAKQRLCEAAKANITQALQKANSLESSILPGATSIPRYNPITDTTLEYSDDSKHQTCVIVQLILWLFISTPVWQYGPKAALSLKYEDNHGIVHKKGCSDCSVVCCYFMIPLAFLGVNCWAFAETVRFWRDECPALDGGRRLGGEHMKFSGSMNSTNYLDQHRNLRGGSEDGAFACKPYKECCPVMGPWMNELSGSCLSPNGRFLQISSYMSVIGGGLTLFWILFRCTRCLRED